jgi:hypothetical protein
VRTSLGEGELSAERMEFCSNVVKLTYVSLRKNRVGLQYLERYPLLEEQQRQVIVLYYQKWM